MYVYFKSPSKVSDSAAEKEPSKDNYEEVEMDIDSDPESAGELGERHLPQVFFLGEL